MLPHTQRITVQYVTDGGDTRVVITDALDDTAAEADVAFAAGDFTLADLFGATSDYAIVQISRAGTTTRYTGEEFARGVLLADLDGIQPAWVKFEDLAAGA